jgi:predicted SprT family Zn-dependent metalloprotease
MTVIDLNEIPEPKEGTRAVLALKFIGPAIRGHGPTSYRCKRCHTILLEKVTHGQVRNIVIKCGKCNSFMEVP